MRLNGKDLKTKIDCYGNSQESSSCFFPLESNLQRCLCLDMMTAIE